MDHAGIREGEREGGREGREGGGEEVGGRWDEERREGGVGGRREGGGRGRRGMGGGEEGWEETYSHEFRTNHGSICMRRVSLCYSIEGTQSLQAMDFGSRFSAQRLPLFSRYSEAVPKQVSSSTQAYIRKPRKAL